MNPELLFFYLFGTGIVLFIIGYLVGVDAKKRWGARYGKLQDSHIALQKDHLQHLRGSKKIVDRYRLLVEAWNVILAWAIKDGITLPSTIVETIGEDMKESIRELYHKEE